MTNQQTLATLTALVNYALTRMDAPLKRALEDNGGITDTNALQEMSTLLNVNRLPLTLGEHDNVKGYVELDKDSVKIGIIGKNSIEDAFSDNFTIMTEVFENTLYTRVYGDNAKNKATEFINMFEV